MVIPSWPTRSTARRSISIPSTRARWNIWVSSMSKPGRSTRRARTSCCSRSYVRAAARSSPISNRLLPRRRPKPASSRPPTIEGAHVVEGPGGGGVCRPPPVGGDLPARSLEQAHGLFGGCSLHTGLRHPRGAFALRHRPRAGLRHSDRVWLPHPRRRAPAGGLLPTAVVFHRKLGDRN